MPLGKYISMITLDVNWSNGPAKTHGLVERIQKQDPCVGCLQEIHFTPWNAYILKVREWKKIFRTNESQKKE